MSDFSKGVVIALAPEDGESFWQPLPSTGYIINKINPYNSPHDRSQPVCRYSSLARIFGVMRTSAVTSCCSAIEASGWPTLRANATKSARKR